MYIRSYLTHSLIEATGFMNCPISLFIRMNIKYVLDSTERLVGRWRGGGGVGESNKGGPNYMVGVGVGGASLPPSLGVWGSSV